MEKAKLKLFKSLSTKLVNIIAFFCIACFLANISIPFLISGNPDEQGKGNISRTDSPIILLSATIKEVRNLNSPVFDKPEIKVETEPQKTEKPEEAKIKPENTTNRKPEDSEINADSKAKSQNNGDTEPSAVWETVRMRVTAYCPCPKCCGEYSDGVTACGHVIQPGDTFVAADRRYSFHTEMLIPGYSNSKPVKVLDRGGAIKGNKLDVFFATHQEALEWGVKFLDVKIRLKNL
ncbi:MAG: 3D domain-containing protein [Sedimentisphaerales bacterium]|nr:3D domain-containing protein [Sedimentisphaerales bacterium]